MSEYLKQLPPDRKKVVSGVRTIIKRNLPAGFVEGMQYGMISYFVPLSRLPDTYNGQPLAILSLASQKQAVSLYLMSIYADKTRRSWFEREWKKRGKRLDMGKSCLRFRSLDDLALDVIAEAVAKVDVETFVAQYEKTKKKSRPRRQGRPGHKAITRSRSSG